MPSAPIAGDQSEVVASVHSSHSLEQPSAGEAGRSRARRPSCARRGTRAGGRRSRAWRSDSSSARFAGQVLLDGPAAEHDRDRALGAVAMDAADEARDPLVAREVALVRRRRAGRSCPTGGRARRRCPDGGGGHGRARARRGSRRGRCGSRRGRERGQDLVGERTGVAGARRVRSRSGRPGRSGSRAAAAARRAGSAREECSAYSGPSCATSIGLLLGRVGMGPDERGQLGLQDAARDRDGLGLAARLGVEPGRRLVAGLLPHRLVAPGPAGRLRVVGSRPTRSGRALSISSNWYSKRATSGAGAVSSQDVPRRVSSCGSRSRSSWARRTAARRRRGSGNWKRISITGVCRLRANSRAEPSFRDGSGRFGH